MKARLAAALILLCAQPAFAADATATKILSGDTLRLADGRVLRLAGVKAATPDAAAFLQSVVGRPLDLEGVSIDRYGRSAALATVAGGTQSLQDEMVQRGLAFVYPAAGGDLPLDAMLADEGAARSRRLGYWAGHSDTPAGDAGALIGHYGFVDGKILAAARVKGKVYLNFGADWRTDFTIAVAARDARRFKKAGLDLLALGGRTVRARGWVTRDFGPMIVATDPHQIEILN